MEPARKITINDIFNGNRILEIPFFQRAYVWGETEWERLLEDMELVTTSNKPHFLGSVILKQKDTFTLIGVGDIRTVIDGQQRLTTLNIFFKVLCLKTNSKTSFDRLFKLENNELALCHNHNNIASFEKVLNLGSLDELKNKDTDNIIKSTDKKNTDNIIEAYNYFKDKIDTAKIDKQKILNNIIFVVIDLGNKEDEQQIFDTINSLGVRLTTAELLKNYFFNRNEIDNYNKYWKQLFEKDDETKSYWDREITTGRSKRTFIDLFFYSYLQIKTQELETVKRDDKKLFSKVENLFASYKKFIKDYKLDIKDILKEIEEYAILFKDNFNFYSKIVDEELTAESGIERINAIIFGLENSTLIPYALYILKNVEDENKKNELFAVIESYVMRRMVVKATTKNYNQLFTDRLILKKILSKEKFVQYFESIKKEGNRLPNDAELKKYFENPNLNNKQAAGIIYLIESKIRDRNKQATSLLGINQYSLEHLMPKKWENNWNKLSTKEDKENRNLKLKTLGNLAIITQSLNASIRDSNWLTKKEGSGNKKGLKDYSGGIETLAPYLELSEWNETEIEKRADFLLKKATEVWTVK